MTENEWRDKIKVHCRFRDHLENTIAPVICRSVVYEAPLGMSSALTKIVKVRGLCEFETCMKLNRGKK